MDFRERWLRTIQCCVLYERRLGKVFCMYPLGQVSDTLTITGFLSDIPRRSVAALWAFEHLKARRPNNGNFRFVGLFLTCVMYFRPTVIKIFLIVVAQRTIIHSINPAILLFNWLKHSCSKTSWNKFFDICHAFIKSYVFYYGKHFKTCDWYFCLSSIHRFGISRFSISGLLRFGKKKQRENIGFYMLASPHCVEVTNLWRMYFFYAVIIAVLIVYSVTYVCNICTGLFPL